MYDFFAHGLATIPLKQEIFLLLVACLAGFVDTVVGGGGLITIPALLGVGMPPALALGTNKLQGCIGELVASAHFIRKSELALNNLMFGLSITVIASIIGGYMVQVIPAQILQKYIPFLLLFACIAMILLRQLKLSPSTTLSKYKFYLIFGLAIGFYNGFFGPATGTLWVVAFVLFSGLNLKQSIMHTKPLNFIGNIAALFVFIFHGEVAWIAGIGKKYHPRIRVHSFQQGVDRYTPILFRRHVISCPGQLSGRSEKRIGMGRCQNSVLRVTKGMCKTGNQLHRPVATQDTFQRDAVKL